MISKHSLDITCQICLWQRSNLRVLSHAAVYVKVSDLSVKAHPISAEPHFLNSGFSDTVWM